MFLNLFNLIINNLVTPLINDLNTSGFIDRIVIFLNNFLNSFFDMFHDAPSTDNVSYISIELIADVIGVVMLIIFIVLIYSMFKLVFESLKIFIIEAKKEISLNAYLEKKGGRKKIKL